MVEITKELKKLIEDNAIALTTVDESGNPHCIAVGFVKAISKNQILVTDNYMHETKLNLEKNQNVALSVWNANWKENCIGYELKGTAEYFIEGEWHDAVKKIPENEGEPCKGAILITITKIKKVS
jgi:predicted pyridoxine 5'-phosphate oxidase superfamily flavin-nucleotide-binding protein